MRREIPIVITFVVGIFMILKFFFLPVDWVKYIAEEIEKTAQVAMTGAIVLGLANVLRINLRAVAQRRRDWPYKLALLASLFMMLIAGFWAIVDVGVPTQETTLFYQLFINVEAQLSATMFSLLAFFIASAAYRAFRMRNLQASLMMAAAVIVMLGRVPLGRWLCVQVARGIDVLPGGETLNAAVGTDSLLPNVTDYMMSVINTAGQRSIFIGVALGVLAVSLRVIFGIERPYLKGE